MDSYTKPISEQLEALLGESVLAQSLATAIITVMIAGLIWVAWRIIDRFRKRLHKAMDVDDNRWIRGISIQDQQIFTEREVTRFAHQFVNYSWVAIRILLVLAFLNLVFSQFDWSRGIAIKVIMFTFETLKTILQGIIEYLPNLVVILVIVVMSRVILRVIKAVFDGIRLERISIPGFYPEWARTSFSLTRLLVIAITVIIVFPYLPGSGSPAFQGLSIFFGVLFSLGSTSAIANIIAGIVITYTRAIKVGDRVRIADTEGDVIERSTFVTRIRTPKNVEVAIPNSMVMGNHIVNFSAQAKDAGVLIHTTVTIGYDIPWNRVHKLLMEAACRTELLLEDPEPFVLQTSLDDNYVAYELNAYTRKPSSKQTIHSDLHANIQDCFREADVEILSPHYRANRDGNESTVPIDTSDANPQT